MKKILLLLSIGLPLISNAQYDVNGGYKISGNLGLGTPNPISELHIHRGENQVNAATVDIRLSQFNGESKISGLYTGTNRGGLSFSTENGTAGLIEERMRIAANGNLGLGTPNPSSELHIHGSENQVNSATVDIMLSQFDGQSMISGLYTGTNKGGLSFSTENGTAGLIEERMRIRADGNVGIGTNAPFGDLHIHRPENQVNSASADIVLSQFNAYNKISGLYTGTFKGGITFSTSNGVHKQIEERMRIRADGNVGIGTNAPFGDLHIHRPENQVNSASADIVLSQFNAYNKISGLYTGTFRGGISFSTSNGVHKQMEEQMRILANGNIGLGTASPSERLEVRGLIKIQDASSEDNNSPGIVLNSDDDFQFEGKILNQYGFGFHRVSNGRPKTYVSGHWGLNFFAGSSRRMTIRNDGKIGIGVDDDSKIDSKLTVAGNIHSREVKVTVAAGADFVFDSNYQLRTLEETEAFITANKHLPEIASEEKMIQDGLEVGKMNIKLLQKIEELTLYLIEQNQRINKLEAKNTELEKVISTLK